MKVGGERMEAVNSKGLNIETICTYATILFLTTEMYQMKSPNEIFLPRNYFSFTKYTIFQHTDIFSLNTKISFTGSFTGSFTNVYLRIFGLLNVTICNLQIQRTLLHGKHYTYDKIDGNHFIISLNSIYNNNLTFSFDKLYQIEFILKHTTVRTSTYT